MKRDGWKWALAGGAIALLIVYGLDSADNGIRNVYGPVGADVQPPAVNSSSNQLTTETASTVEQYEPNASTRGNNDNTSASNDNGTFHNAYAGNERLPGVPYDTSEPTVNKLADGAAGVLQSVSSGGIKWFVSVFDGIMD
ncbi:hypothetical protein DFQ01_11834 [Paenibacillus cellulosilyticus]|uniref:Uncharacterized protein n=1 Tax=Paenibacillus cellulosilyticus TaxID=375489 RepID=A0A2V2YPH4_9BACL|nr:hypothetical protein [Paenibacillus cellulosilyticus]PWV98400.1 hypothetical protein DFQ01_11834 [Paenibacillus cellulosilyticus]QKS43249.1 hypothetical protein HUB94_01885 [Paenibacillus cellulosilyticus]